MSEHDAPETPVSSSAADPAAPDPADKPQASKWRRFGLPLAGFLVTGAIGFGVGQGYMTWRARQDAAAAEDPQGPRVKVRLRGDEPQHGPDDALVTIIEFSDYECPYCARASGPLMEAVEGEDDVRVIFKHLPLPFHKKATPAAKAAWAAHQQGKFWEASDYLFEHKADVSNIDAFVQEHGLDAERFRNDMTGDKAAMAVDDDLKAAGMVGVRGTPGFVVNGRIYSGAMPVERWEVIIDKARDEAEALVDDGIPKSEVYAELMKTAVERHTPPSAIADNERKSIPVAEHNPVLGPADALVTIVVFSDFQCPFCGRAAPGYKEAVESNDDVRVVFKNLPLPMHRQAKDAAIAALAAGRQGKFWEMHDYLFEHRDEIASAAKNQMVSFAEAIGLNVDEFKTDFADARLAEQVDADSKLAREIGVQATPTTFINGRAVRGARSAAELAPIIEEERKKAAALVEQGTARDKVYETLMAQNAKAKG